MESTNIDYATAGIEKKNFRKARRNYRYEQPNPYLTMQPYDPLYVAQRCPTNNVMLIPHNGIFYPTMAPMYPSVMPIYNPQLPPPGYPNNTYNTHKVVSYVKINENKTAKVTDVRKNADGSTCYFLSMSKVNNKPAFTHYSRAHSVNSSSIPSTSTSPTTDADVTNEICTNMAQININNGASGDDYNKMSGTLRAEQKNTSTLLANNNNNCD